MAGPAFPRGEVGRVPGTLRVATARALEIVTTRERTRYPIGEMSTIARHPFGPGELWTESIHLEQVRERYDSSGDVLGSMSIVQ